MKKLFGRAVDWVQQHPAMIGLAASTVVSVAANYGLKLNLTDTTAFMVAANAVLFSWVHGQVSPVVATGWQIRK